MGAAKRFAQNPGNTAICYYRYSSDAQRDASIEQQRVAAQEYAKDHGYHIVREYEDHALSGTRDDRPDFQLMLYEVEQLRPAYLIVWKTDRLSRDKYDAAIAKGRLRKCGVKIVYIAETVPDDDEATSILVESINEAVAASFIASLRKNVMRGMLYNAQNAMYNGIRVLGYVGKKNQKYQIDDATAPIVRRIYTEYANGTPLKVICDELTADGLKSNNGKDFSINSLRHILTNRAYIGEYRYKDIVIADGMPRLIDDDMFQAVQNRLAANRRGGKAAVKKIHPEADIADFWLTGKLHCGLCGAAMQGISGTGKKGDLYYYYSCQNHRRHTCELKNKRKDLLEKIVHHILHDMLFNPAVRICIADKCYAYYKTQNDDGGAYETSIKAQLKDVESKLSNIMSAIEVGIFNDTTAERMRILESQKSTLNNALLDVRNRKKYELKPETVLRFLEAYADNLNDSQSCQKALDFLVDGIYVYPDKLAVTCYYTDDRREFEFEHMADLFETQEEIAKLLNDRSDLQNNKRAKKMLSSLIDENESEEGEQPDFFP